MNTEERITRRTFLDYFLGGGFFALAAATFYPVVRYILPPKGGEADATRVVAAKVAELGKPSSAAPPHLNCPVQYDPAGSFILCACHNGHFDLNGQVISGPPPRPLEQLSVNVRGDDVVVSRRGWWRSPCLP